MLALLVIEAFTAACATVDNLKPGVVRGPHSSGFLKTTESLALEVRDRSYDNVCGRVERAWTWAATERAGLIRGSLHVVDRSKDRGIIRAEEHTSHGLARAYVGIFIAPPTPGATVYVVEASKILMNRTEVVEGRDWEQDLQHAVQRELR